MRKAYFFLVALIIWMLLFWYHYVFNIKQVGATAPVTPMTVEKAPVEVILPNILLFQKGRYQIIAHRGQTTLIDSILAEGNSTQILQITGLYTVAEQTGLPYDLGNARAAALKKVLLPYIPEQRMEIFSDTISTFKYLKDSLVAGVFYEWVDGFDKNEPVNSFVLQHRYKRVKTEPFDELLSEIAARLIETGERIIIIGHVDDTGDKELNFTIALRNAKDIRDVLKAKGVNRKQIETTSRGEEQPLIDNSTEEERIENRRVEMEIVGG
ncbi:MAG: OmpA family protein [Bacteroidota bacterium]